MYETSYFNILIFGANTLQKSTLENFTLGDAILENFTLGDATL